MILLRQMRLSDIPAIMQIEADTPAGLTTRPLAEQVYVNELTTNQQAWFVVAEAPATSTLKDDLVGFAWLQMFYDEAHVMNIVTRPECQGRGIGWQLMQALLAEARRRQAICLTLEVRASNAPAQALYRKCGLQLVGQRKRYYRDNNEDALIMTLMLGA